MLEDALRDMFAERADASPIAAAPASVAVASGRAHQRRRNLAAGFALVMVLVAITAGGLSLSDVWVRTPDGTTQQAVVGPADYVKFGPPLSAAERMSEPMELSLDIRMGNRMVSAAGNWYVLDGIDTVQTVVRVPAGWLYADAANLRLMRTDGTSVPLLTHVSKWIVAPGGDRIAAVTATRMLRVFPLGARGLGMPMSVTIPAGATPVAFLGSLIAMRHPDGVRYDFWDPATLEFKPAWSATLGRIFDSAGSDVFGLVGDSRLCLVRLSVMTTLRTGSAIGCGAALDGALSRSVISPDGRLLAVPTTKGLNIIDLAAGTGTSTVTAAEPVVASTCVADSGTVPVWSALDTVISTASGMLIACSVDGPRRAVTLPDGIGTGWQLVPIRA
jgi:hypothetical protein